MRNYDLDFLKRFSLVIAFLSLVTVGLIVFASYLNVRKDAVSKWERGEKRPDGPSLKLLNLVKTKGLRSIA